MELIPCTAIGVWYGSAHLKDYPRSQTSPVSYCPTCCGFGTVRVND